MRENQATLERLFDQRVVYGNPLVQRAGLSVDTSVKSDVLSTMRDVYVDVNRKLFDTDKVDEYLTSTYGPKYVLPPSYVAAVDVFYPEIGLLPVGNHLVPLPMGHASAFYHGGTQSLAIDTMAIPGTRKNKWARDLYNNALNLVDRLADASPTVYGGLRRLKSFYKGILDELSSWKRMRKTGVHEMGHHVLEMEGVANYLTPSVNEGFTENLTQEVTGERASLEGTTYDHYMNMVGAGIRKVAGSVKNFISKYRQRGKSVIESLYRQPEVNSLPVAA